MLSLNTEVDVLRGTAEAVRRQRLALNLPQADLASRSGVPLGTLRRLEQTGQGSLLVLAKVLTTLGMADQFLAALKRSNDTAQSLDAFMAAKAVRQRARRSTSTRNDHPRA
jgi:transcriptional regulator with XRE-family HTH domain